MNTTTLLIIIAAIVLVLVALALSVVRRRTRLRARFGSEYERVAQSAGSADAELAARARRVEQYRLRPLAPDEGTRFTDAWRRLQSRFVDDPSGAVNEADVLVTELMAARGYPMSEFERRAEDLSVDHASVVNHYREAHQIATRQTQSRIAASTEELRQAVMHYRALFEDLLETATSPRRMPA